MNLDLVYNREFKGVNSRDQVLQDNLRGRMKDKIEEMNDPKGPQEALEDKAIR